MHTLNKPEISLKVVNKAVITRFLIILVLLGTILTGILVFFYYLENRDHISHLKGMELQGLMLQKQVIAKNIDMVTSDLLFLSKQNERHLLFEHNDPNSRDKIAREYFAFIKEKHLYDQIRFLDEKGMETVRVNFNNGSPAIVPIDQLQAKGKRYYFKDTFNLDQGQIFISPFDLNIEKGEIEHPLKPMIRFGTPVFDNHGRKRGVVILNYLGDRLLSALKEMEEMSPGNTMLLNADGFWILSPNPEDEWGFMFKSRKDRYFAKTFPGVWQEMSKSENNQIHDKNGLFTATTFYPLPETAKSSTGATKAFEASGKMFTGRQYYWKLVSHIPADALIKNTQDLRSNLILLGLILFFVAIIPSWLITQAIARKKVYQQKLLNLAHYDILTGIPNRALFLDRLNQVYKQASRFQQRFSLLYVDLDDFKEVNDELGHDAGDELLKRVTEKLLFCLRESDTVARLGGDEFTIILNKIENPEDIVKVVRKIMDTLSIPFNLKGIDKTIGFSIGISQFPQDAKDPETLLKHADTAMYQAKESGKNTYKFYS